MNASAVNNKLSNPPQIGTFLDTLIIKKGKSFCAEFDDCR